MSFERYDFRCMATWRCSGHGATLKKLGSSVCASCSGLGWHCDTVRQYDALCVWLFLTRKSCHCHHCSRKGLVSCKVPFCKWSKARYVLAEEVQDSEQIAHDCTTYRGQEVWMLSVYEPWPTCVCSVAAGSWPMPRNGLRSLVQCRDQRKGLWWWPDCKWFIVNDCQYISDSLNWTLTQ